MDLSGPENFPLFEYFLDGEADGVGFRGIRSDS
jgi:hypothetical protein